MARLTEQQVFERVKTRFSDRKIELVAAQGDPWMKVEPSAWADVALFLRDDPEDHGAEEDREDVVEDRAGDLDVERELHGRGRTLGRVRAEREQEEDGDRGRQAVAAHVNREVSRGIPWGNRSPS